MLWRRVEVRRAVARRAEYRTMVGRERMEGKERRKGRVTFVGRVNFEVMWCSLVLGRTRSPPWPPPPGSP